MQVNLKSLLTHGDKEPV